MNTQSKFLSRKFLITLLCMLIAAVNLDGSDLALVLSACVSSYSIANAGSFVFNKWKEIREKTANA